MASEELRLVNAFYGFCVRSTTWPSPLADLDYRPCGVEREIRVLVDGSDRTVLPDLICASVQGQHVLCFEIKSRTVHQDQSTRYKAITTSSLLNAGNLPPETEPLRLSYEVVYVTSRKNSDVVIRQLAKFDTLFPVVAAGDQLFELASGSINQPDVQKVFSSTIDVEGFVWPLHYVPFNSHSSPGEIAPHIARALSEFIIKGLDFTGEELAEKATPHWIQCGPRERRTIRDKLVELVNVAVSNELKGYCERVGPARIWRISQRPSGYQALGRFKRLLVDFVERTEQGRPPAPSVVQLELFPGGSTEVVVDEEALDEEDEDE